MQTPGKPLGQFGIGCVHFRPKDVNAPFVNFGSYVKRLEKSLGYVAAAYDINIQSDNTLDNFESGLPQPFSLLSEDEYPDLASGTGAHLELTLKIKIPERRQREILDRYEGATTIDLSVYFTYQYDTPLMLVYLDGVKHGISPSTSVRLVREFLRLEMESNANCEFTIDVLGPSPFHADFTLVEIPSITEMKWSRTPIRGYDSVTIEVPPGLGDMESIILYLERNLLDDFDTFYMITLERNQVTNSWYSCVSEVSKLQETLNSTSKFRRALSRFIPTVPTYDLATKIADFRLTNMSATERINQRLIDDALITQSPIWVDIENGRKAFPKYDIESLEKLVDFFDRRQTHRQSIANTIFAAVAGGVAGALAAWFIQPTNHLAAAQSSAIQNHGELTSNSGNLQNKNGATSPHSPARSGFHPGR